MTQTNPDVLSDDCQECWRDDFVAFCEIWNWFHL